MATKIHNVILRYTWDKSEDQRATGHISASNALRSRGEGGVGLLHTQTMRDALVLHWIQRMNAHSKDPEKAPDWYQVTVDILLHNVHKAVLTNPLVQKWDSVNHLMPPSISYFWDPWVSKTGGATPHRENLIHPSTSQEVEDLLFWYHPCFQGYATARWWAPTWTGLAEGKFGVVPTTLGDLRLLRAKSTNELQVTSRDRTNMHKAIDRLFDKLPDAWKEVWPGQLPVAAQPNEGALFNQVSIFRPHYAPEHALLSMDNKPRYRFLLQRIVTREDLLRSAKQQAELDGFQLNNLTDQEIWKRTAPKSAIFYPKFTDLLWRMLLGNVSTGLHWMDSQKCPECNLVQTAQHLFWACSIAKEIWKEVSEIWGNLGVNDWNDLSCYSDILFGYLRTYKEPGIQRRAYPILRGAMEHPVPTMRMEP